MKKFVFKNITQLVVLALGFVIILSGFIMAGDTQTVVKKH